MSNLSVFIFKALLSALSIITIAFSFFLIILVCDMWAQEGIPPLENIKFSIALFIVTVMLLIICQCFKYLVDMAIDTRNKTIR